MGRYMHARARFLDDSPVQALGSAKSRSNETTFPQDVADHEQLETVLRRLAEGLCTQLRDKDVRGRNVAIKVRLDDWTTVTRARTIAEPTNDAETVVGVALELFRAYAPPRPVRLLGVRVAAFEPERPLPQRRPPQLALPL
jgi:DNA polymerase-4